VEGEHQPDFNQSFYEPVEMSNARRWAVTAGVMTGMFIAALEATVVGTAMPTVIASLGGINHYSWVFSAYIVTSTVTVPVWGKLSDLYGRRLMYQLAIALFLVGTLLSGVSNSMTQLIIFRAIQGLGAGGLIPLGMTIIGDTFSVQERAKMQAYFSGVWGLSSVIGPVIGGFITDQISWRWVFFVNLRERTLTPALSRSTGRGGARFHYLAISSRDAKRSAFFRPKTRSASRRG